MRKVYFRFYQFEKGNFSIKAFGVSFFAFYKTSGFFWFRIFGYGLVIKDYKKHGLLFSERYKRNLKIGKYLIKILKP